MGEQAKILYIGDFSVNQEKFNERDYRLLLIENKELKKTIVELKKIIREYNSLSRKKKKVK